MDQHLRNGEESLLFLLQISNASFPTGSFSHSYGFETWLHERVVDSPEEADKRCRHWLRYGVATGDGVAVAQAFRKTLYENMEDIEGLNGLVGALKLGRESREASTKTGSAFLSACRQIFELASINRLDAMAQNKATPIHHAVAYGVVFADMGFSEKQAVETFLWSAYSNLASVVGRLLPIGQVQLQKMIAAAAPLVDTCSEIARSRTQADMCSTYSSLDAASMRHERLPTRLCIS